MTVWCDYSTIYFIYHITIYNIQTFYVAVVTVVHSDSPTVSVSFPPALPPTDRIFLTRGFLFLRTVMKKIRKPFNWKCMLGESNQILRIGGLEYPE